MGALLQASITLVGGLWYARRGWAVLPIWWPEGGRCGCGDAGCQQPAKHPIGHLAHHGSHSATRDARRILGWWRTCPRANVGIATGPASRLLVLDVDPDKGGADSLAELRAQHGELPDTPTSLTGGGGEHYLFAYAGDDIRNSAGKLGAGLDVRGRGGYIVAPPSIHLSGGRYLWEASSRPERTPLAPPPAWLLQLLRADPASEPRPRLDTARILAGVPEGERDSALFRLAAKLRAADVPQDLAEQLVLQAAAHCRPPFPAKQAVAKVASAYGRYQAGPTIAARAAPSLEERVARRVRRKLGAAS